MIEITEIAAKARSLSRNTHDGIAIEEYLLRQLPTLTSDAVAGGEPVFGWVLQEAVEFLQKGQLENNLSSTVVHSHPNEEMGWTVAVYLAPPTTELDALQKEREVASTYLRNLLHTFVSEHFPDNDEWKPLDDLVGMLTQIDNASTIAREYKTRLAEAMKSEGEATEYIRADLATLSPDAARDALTELDQLREKVKELEKALDLIDALDPEEHVYGCSADALRGLIIQMGQIARRVREGAYHG